jgi:hypothetical protein
MRFIAEYDDGSKEPFDVYDTDPRTRDHIAGIIATAARPHRFSTTKAGKIVRVYRTSYFLFASRRRAH